MAPRGRTERVLVRRFDGEVLRRQPDELIVEEPMEIRLDGTRVATTMRTPGHDFELAAGFCHAEGLLAGAPVQTCRYCGPRREASGERATSWSAVESEFNVVSVETGGLAPAPTPRVGTTSSSCGMCGSTAVDDLRARLQALPPTSAWDLRLLARLPQELLGQQPLFERTGAVHSAAAFDRDGHVAVLREDIGRHNAVDKVVGRLLLDERLPASELGLYVSGRASFEIVQKAWAAGMPVVVAVSAPSALAVAAARQAGITLCGFVRRGELNVYAGDG